MLKDSNQAFLEYVDGSPLIVDRPTQLIQRDGNLYSVQLPADFPVSLSGNWATDEPLLVNQVDRALRAELVNETDLALGAAVVGRSAVVVESLADLVGSPRKTTHTYHVPWIRGHSARDARCQAGPAICHGIRSSGARIVAQIVFD
ncbi:hypothetical protein [Pseudomonas aeruginosa]|uniref:hypothetical protein n=1 Tax=Pseudomonas aeruginosa TaxID=287 RepID=UPI0022EAD1F3|nr:hypothetical protein [Pseudomonas aeruginosa]